MVDGSVRNDDVTRPRKGKRHRILVVYRCCVVILSCKVRFKIKTMKRKRNVDSGSTTTIVRCCSGWIDGGAAKTSVVKVGSD